MLLHSTVGSFSAPQLLSMSMSMLSHLISAQLISAQLISAQLISRALGELLQLGHQPVVLVALVLEVLDRLEVLALLVDQLMW